MFTRDILANSDGKDAKVMWYNQYAWAYKKFSAGGVGNRFDKVSRQRQMGVNTYPGVSA